MAQGNDARPIIIKKVKKGGGEGHHGGAWKVAYADFVTAMMAFFMLMWLLNATTEQQRKGLADYFNPSVTVKRISGGGNGLAQGDTVFAENTLAQNGMGASSQHPVQAGGKAGSFKPGEGEAGARRSEKEIDLVRLEEFINNRAGESIVSPEVLKHVVTRVTDEGLVIELFGLEDKPLFHANNRPSATLSELSRLIGEAAAIVTNDIAIEAHTAAFPIVRRDDPVWQVTAERADHMRDLLGANDVGRGRIARLTAHGDAEPVSDNPMNRRNNRLEIIFLR